jgi:hypothetical protein
VGLKQFLDEAEKYEMRIIFSDWRSRVSMHAHTERVCCSPLVLIRFVLLVGRDGEVFDTYTPGAWKALRSVARFMHMQSLSWVNMRKLKGAVLLSPANQAIWLDGSLIPDRSTIHAQSAASRGADKLEAHKDYSLARPLAHAENLAAANTVKNKSFKQRRAVSASRTLPPEKRMINDEERQQLEQFYQNPANFHPPQLQASQTIQVVLGFEQIILHDEA